MSFMRCATRWLPARPGDKVAGDERGLEAANLLREMDVVAEGPTVKAAAFAAGKALSCMRPSCSYPSYFRHNARDTLTSYFPPVAQGRVSP